MNGHTAKCVTVAKGTKISPESFREKHGIGYLIFVLLKSGVEDLCRDTTVLNCGVVIAL